MTVRTIGGAPGPRIVGTVTGAAAIATTAATVTAHLVRLGHPAHVGSTGGLATTATSARKTATAAPEGTAISLLPVTTPARVVIRLAGHAAAAAAITAHLVRLGHPAHIFSTGMATTATSARKTATAAPEGTAISLRYQVTTPARIVIRVAGHATAAAAMTAHHVRLGDIISTGIWATTATSARKTATAAAEGTAISLTPVPTPARIVIRLAAHATAPAAPLAHLVHLGEMNTTGTWAATTATSARKTATAAAEITAISLTPVPTPARIVTAIAANATATAAMTAHLVRLTNAKNLALYMGFTATTVWTTLIVRAAHTAP